MEQMCAACKKDMNLEGAGAECYRLNACVTPKSYVETLIHSVTVWIWEL